jgi:hypothetical protein
MTDGSAIFGNRRALQPPKKKERPPARPDGKKSALSLTFPVLGSRQVTLKNLDVAVFLARPERRVCYAGPLHPRADR